MGDLYKKQLRYVKQREGKGFGVIPAKQLESLKDLCSLCGIKEVCRIRKLTAKLKEEGSEVKMGTCKRYVPILTFRGPHIGLDAGIFNTLRAGTTWAFKLKKGSIVCLADSESEQAIRYMRVTSVFTGSVESMLNTHSKFNHLAVGGETVDHVKHVIRKSYGHFLGEDGMLTAIYLRNIREEPADYHYHLSDELVYMGAVEENHNVVSIAKVRESLSSGKATRQ